MTRPFHAAAVRQARPLALALLAGLAAPVLATENGGSSYPMGADGFMAGALPPPGFYAQVFANHYEADSLRDNRGDELPVDFSVRADVIAPRLIWVTEQQILGGNLALHALFPLVDLEVSVNGQSQDKQGLGDIIFGAGVGFHHSDKLHSIVSLDFIAPSGRYDADDLANPGRNYWVVQPVLAATYVDPDGLNADIKAMYSINRENPDTDYRSGQELHADYSLGWGLGNGWVVGVGGYAYRQTTDDRLDGETVDDNKGRAFAIGPAVKYTSKDGWFVHAKWQQESQVRNRAEGDAYWVKLTVPF